MRSKGKHTRVLLLPIFITDHAMTCPSRGVINKTMAVTSAFFPLARKENATTKKKQSHRKHREEFKTFDDDTIARFTFLRWAKNKHRQYESRTQYLVCG